MDWKRIGRAAMCVLVICCLLFNLSPIRAQAVVIESSLLFGVVAVAILTAAGVVFAPQTAEDVMALGDHMHSHLYSWGTSAEKLEEVDDFFDSLRLLNFGGSGDDVPDVSKNTKVTIARAILAGITAWVGTVILDGATRRKPVYSSSNYPEDLPVLPEWDMDRYPYFFVAHRSPPGINKHFYQLVYSDAPVTYIGDFEGFYYYSPRPVSSFPECTHSLMASMIDSTGAYYDWSYTVEDSLLTNSENLENSMYSIDYGSWSTPSYAFKIAYSNYHIYDLNGDIHFEGDDDSVTYVDVTYLPDLLLGDAAPGIADGTVDPDDIELPESLELGGIVTSTDSAVQDIIAAQDNLVNNPDQYDEYMQELIDPSAPVDPDSDVDADTVGNTPLSTFINKLINPINEALQDLGNMILGGIRDIFVPSSDYLTAKVNALCAEFSFADSITKTAKGLIDGLQGISTEPPVIYIDLSANTGPYDLGGEVPFLDLRWYAAYKPTVDTIISAFLWACFIWRMFLKLPGIINGASGTFTLIHSRDQEDV